MRQPADHCSSARLYMPGFACCSSSAAMCSTLGNALQRCPCCCDVFQGCICAASALTLHEVVVQQAAPKSRPCDMCHVCRAQSHLEARLWNDVFVEAQAELGIPRGSIRVGGPWRSTLNTIHCQCACCDSSLAGLQG